MEDLLRDDTLRAHFATYDYDSHAKCLTECTSASPDTVITLKALKCVCWWLPRLILHKAENSAESVPRFHCLFIRDF